MTSRSDGHDTQGDARALFYRRYRYQSVSRSLREQRRRDALVPAELAAQSSQDYCEQLASHLRELLSSEELRLVGDFFVGLTDEPRFSASIEPVGRSHLILVHRRLFNALQFVSDVITHPRLTATEQAHHLARYLSALVLAASRGERLSPHLPRSPDLESVEHSIASSVVNGSLFRFVVSHELGHVVATRQLACGFTDTDAHAELLADAFAFILPLRETRLDSVSSALYFSTSLLAPFLFLYLLSAFEQLLAVVASSQPATSHPPSVARTGALLLHIQRDLPQHIASQAEQLSMLWEQFFRQIVCMTNG